MTDVHDGAHPTTDEGAMTGDGARRGISPRLSRWIAAVLAVVAVLAAVALVLELTMLRPRYEQARADDRARADVTRVAERFTVQANNYSLDNLDKYGASLSSMLSPKFKQEFDKAKQDILTQVKQSKMSSKGEVLTSAVSSLDPDSAQVLVVADADVKTAYGTRARHFRWEISLVKLDGRWLVDDYSPVV